MTAEEQEREEHDLKVKEQEAEKAKNNLEKKREGGRSILTSQIIERRIEEIGTIDTGNTLEKKSGESAQEKYKRSEDEADITPYKSKKKFLVDTMFPCASRNERKLLSETMEKIFAIIQKSTDKKTSENIINRIKDELR